MISSCFFIITRGEERRGEERRGEERRGEGSKDEKERGGAEIRRRVREEVRRGGVERSAFWLVCIILHV